jgi:hypothetical protein
MDNLLIVVINEGLAPAVAASDASAGAVSPIWIGAMSPSHRGTRGRIAVWRAVRRNSQRAANWHAVGIATALATSVAAWAGVALAISHFVK